MENDEHVEWDLCVMDDQADCSKWVCTINEAIGGPACSAEGAAAGEEAAAGEAADGQADEKKDDKDKPTVILEQPIYMLPLPSPICNIDYNFNSHGDDWMLCGCKEPMQSPINLPDVSCLESMK